MAARPLPRSRPFLLRDTLVVVPLLMVAVLDRLSKVAVSTLLEPGTSLPPEGPVRLTLVTNTGAAFGLLTGQTFFLIVASVVAILALLFLYRFYTSPRPVARLSLGLLLGGSLGNLADRLVLGYVVDFIDLGWWPVFNLADTAIVLGIFLFLASLPPPSRTRPFPPGEHRPPPEVGC